MVESGNPSPTGYVTAGATDVSHPPGFQAQPMRPLQPASEGARTRPTVYAGRHHQVTRSLRNPVGCQGQRRRRTKAVAITPAAAAAPPFQDLANPGLLTAAGPPRRRRALPSGSLARRHSPAVPAAPSPLSPQRWACLPVGADCPPTCPPHYRGLRFCIRNRPLTWSPLTESNRRPAPYHGPRQGGCDRRGGAEQG